MIPSHVMVKRVTKTTFLLVVAAVVLLAWLRAAEYI
jgi:hypothetical protein